MRRIAVPLTIRLDRLHLALQAALGSTDSHLYAFRFSDVTFGVPDPEWGGEPLDARKTTLRAAIEDTGRMTFKYLCDFGDGWEHSVKIEKIEPGLTSLGLPILIAASGRCPPEDVGGSPGYAEFLDVLANPQHEQHDDVIRWAGGPFDPITVDTAAIDKDLDTLARRWNRAKA